MYHTPTRQGIGARSVSDSSPWRHVQGASARRSVAASQARHSVVPGSPAFQRAAPPESVNVPSSPFHPAPPKSVNVNNGFMPRPELHDAYGEEPFPFEEVYEALSMTANNPGMIQVQQKLGDRIKEFQDTFEELQQYKSGVIAANQEIARLESEMAPLKKKMECETEKREGYTNRLAFVTTTYKSLLKTVKPLAQDLLEMAFPDYLVHEDMSLADTVDNMSLADTSMAQRPVAQRPMDVSMDSLGTIRLVWQVQTKSQVRCLHTAMLDSYLYQLKNNGFSNNDYFKKAHNGSPPRIKTSGRKDEKRDMLILLLCITEE